MIAILETAGSSYHFHVWGTGSKYSGCKGQTLGSESRRETSQTIKGFALESKVLRGPVVRSLPVHSKKRTN